MDINILSLIPVIVLMVGVEGKLLCQLSGEHYKPCDSFPNTNQVCCVDSEVNDDILTTISSNLNQDSDKNFGKLVIPGTSFTIIDELFTEIKFEKIFIENNKILKQIKPKAFKKRNLKSLTILEGNSPKSGTE
jgi:hypothetical protein